MSKRAITEMKTIPRLTFLCLSMRACSVYVDDDLYRQLTCDTCH